MTSENFFEQSNFSNCIAVIGAGVIGLELGQALSRLGIDIAVFHAEGFIGGLSDPIVNEVAIKIFKQAFTLHLKEKATIDKKGENLLVKTEQRQFSAKQILAALGRQPNLAALDLDCIDIKFNEYGIPIFDDSTMQLNGTGIFIVGDANKTRPLLHEAADEGRIAGYNAAQPTVQYFRRRVPIYIVFCQPNIAIVGKRYQDLTGSDFVVGEVDYSDQGRARIAADNQGLLRIYGTAEGGRLLGAEMIAPGGEHLAHLLAWAIQQKMTVFDVLQLPYYHPTLEEGMRTVLRDLAQKVQRGGKAFELVTCDSEAPSHLS